MFICAHSYEYRGGRTHGNPVAPIINAHLSACSLIRISRRMEFSRGVRPIHADRTPYSKMTVLATGRQLAREKEREREREREKEKKQRDMGDAELDYLTITSGSS